MEIQRLKFYYSVVGRKTKKTDGNRPEKVNFEFSPPRRVNICLYPFKCLKRAVLKPFFIRQILKIVVFIDCSKLFIETISR